jgi:hypothetical protein
MSRPRRQRKEKEHERRRPRGAWWRRAPVIVVTLVVAVGLVAAAILLRAGASDAGGVVDAAYLNPRPIDVARAEATRAGSTLKVFVELRAPNYPGSTYTLTHDPKIDQLGGAYFQAVQRETFDVVPVRAR